MADAQSALAVQDSSSNSAIKKPYLRTNNAPPTIILIFSCISFVVCFIIMSLYALILVGVLQYYDVIPWWGVLIVILIVLSVAVAPCFIGLIIYEIFRCTQK